MKNYSHLICMHKVLLPSLLFWVAGMQAVMEDLVQARMQNAMKDLVQAGMQDAMKSLMQALMELHKVQAEM
jgi:NCAIR mutase (PurE)-related protein